MQNAAFCIALSRRAYFTLSLLLRADLQSGHANQPFGHWRFGLLDFSVSLSRSLLCPVALSYRGKQLDLVEGRESSRIFLASPPPFLQELLAKLLKRKDPWHALMVCLPFRGRAARRWFGEGKQTVEA